jgi:hypothetical protein
MITQRWRLRARIGAFVLALPHQKPEPDHPGQYQTNDDVQTDHG